MKKELPFEEIIKEIKRSYKIPLTPTPVIIKDKLLRIWSVSGAMSKALDEVWIKKNEELEKQALDEDDETLFELIQRDFGYLSWDYTKYRIYEWQQTIKKKRR